MLENVTARVMAAVCVTVNAFMVGTNVTSVTVAAAVWPAVTVTPVVVPRSAVSLATKPSTATE